MWPALVRLQSRSFSCSHVWLALVGHQSRSYSCSPMCGPPLSDTYQDPTIAHLCVARPCQTPIKILQLFTYVWPALVRHQSGGDIKKEPTHTLDVGNVTQMNFSYVQLFAMLCVFSTIIQSYVIYIKHPHEFFRTA